MARPLRHLVEDGWYHVFGRGWERRRIFRDERDREHFLELLCGLTLREAGAVVGGGLKPSTVAMAISKWEKDVADSPALRKKQRKLECEMAQDNYIEN